MQAQQVSKHLLTSTMEVTQSPQKLQQQQRRTNRRMTKKRKTFLQQQVMVTQAQALTYHQHSSRKSSRMLRQPMPLQSNLHPLLQSLLSQCLQLQHLLLLGHINKHSKEQGQVQHHQNQPHQLPHPHLLQRSQLPWQWGPEQQQPRQQLLLYLQSCPQQSRPSKAQLHQLQ
jgi:hypothetical protein